MEENKIFIMQAFKQISKAIVLRNQSLQRAFDSGQFYMVVITLQFLDYVKILVVDTAMIV